MQCHEYWYGIASEYARIRRLTDMADARGRLVAILRDTADKIERREIGADGHPLPDQSDGESLIE